MPPLVKHLLQEWESAGIPPDFPVILACSGGKDSMVLLDVLVQAGKKPLVAHANFGLRGEESDADEAFVMEQAGLRGLRGISTRFFTRSFAQEQGLSIQMAARELRYAWLQELAKQEGAVAILTAHHALDQAETVLLNLMRGSGIRGMKGMEVLSRGIFRPLLKCEPDEIRRHAGNYRVPWREDASNRSTSYKRNFLRHYVLAPWEERYPGTVRQILRSSELLGEWNVYLEHKLAEDLAFFRHNENPNSLSLSISEHPQARILLRSWLEDFGMADQAPFVLEAATRPGALFSSKEYELLIDRHWMMVRKRQQKENECLWLEPMQNLRMGTWSFTWTGIEDFPGKVSNPFTLLIDPEQVRWPLSLRHSRTGDRIHPFGMNGSKLLSDLFIDAHIDRFEKESWPVLCMDDQVIWVPGLRSSELQRSTKKKGRFLLLRASNTA